MNNDPIILAFCCHYCAYAAADLAGSMRLQYPSNVRVLRLPCTGKIEVNYILTAFERGVDGDERQPPVEQEHLDQRPGAAGVTELATRPLPRLLRRAKRSPRASGGSGVWIGIGIALSMIFDPKTTQATELIDRKVDEKEDAESGDKPGQT